MHSLGSAAAQGGQDTYNEYANGSPFTGWSSDVQALQDAPHHSLITLTITPSCIHRTWSLPAVSGEARTWHLQCCVQEP